ncbi:hypothetical protein GLP43_04805 [Sulfitobacter sp. M39]|nr:hypothetical protein [Sulfitobacter sp. M39]
MRVWSKADMVNRYRKLASHDLSERLLDHGWGFRSATPDGGRNKLRIVNDDRTFSPI